MHRNSSQLSTQTLPNQYPLQDTPQILVQIRREISEILFAVRGIAIVFVVIGHVIGESSSGIRQLYPQDLPLLGQIYNLIYTFHMPVFFLVSGLSFALFNYRRERNLGRFFSGRCQRLLIPLLCWAPFYFGLRCLTGQAEFTGEALLKAIIFPDFIFWFFHSLFLISIGSYLLLNYGSTALYFLVSILLLLASFLFEGIISATFYFNFSYAAGFLLGLGLEQADRLPFAALKKPALAALVGLAGLALLAVFLTVREPFPSLAKLINGFIGFSLLYWVALWAGVNRPIGQQSRRARWIGHLGRISMSIYLLHVMFGSAARIALVKLGLMSPDLHLMLGILVALLGPVFLDALLRPRLKLFLYSIGEAKS